MIRRLVIHIVLITVTGLITGCASSDSGVVTEQGAPAAVPGEKVPGEGTLTPNATSGVPSAGVGW